MSTYSYENMVASMFIRLCIQVYGIFVWLGGECIVCMQSQWKLCKD